MAAKTSTLTKSYIFIIISLDIMSLNNHKPSLRSLHKKEGSNELSHSTLDKGGRGERLGKRKKRHLFRNISIGVAGVIVVVVGLIGYKVLALSGKVIDSDNSSLFDRFKSIVNSSSVRLKGEEEGRINILLLGIGGENHPGSNLTDSIMLASINTKTNQIALLSVPRDLYVELPTGGFSKINSVHAYAEQDQAGSGPEAIMKTVGVVTGITPDYYIRFDFKGFTKAIDDLGGIDVPIDESFYDYLHKVQFNSGVDHMDGARALIYARGRYITPSHLGNDFYRAAKQQQVILAARDKFLSSGSVVNLDLLNKLLNDFGDHMKTNLQIGDLLHLYDLAKDVPKDSISSTVLDEEKNKLIKGSNVMMGGVNASILIPSEGIGQYDKIRELAQNIFDPNFVPETATIEVQNGTTTSGIATKASDQITFEVVKVANATTRDYTATVIYDYSEGKYPRTLKKLEEQFGVGASSLPAKNVRQSSADIVVIVGSEYAAKQ